MDWFYGQIVGFLGNFFSQMGNMGVELFDLAWVQAIVLFFSRLAWALFGVSVVVSCFQFGIMYVSGGRGNLQQTALSIIKGFLAVSLFTVAPVRLYALSVSLQGTFSAGITGYGTSIGEVGQEIVEELSEIDTLSEMLNNSYFGLGVLTSSFMILFCIILMTYAVVKVFFANLKRGGILLIQIAVGSLYMFSIPRGYTDAYTAIYICLLEHGIKELRKKNLKGVLLSVAGVTVTFLPQLAFNIYDGAGLPTINVGFVSLGREVLTAILPPTFYIEYSLMFALMGICIYFSKGKWKCLVFAAFCVLSYLGAQSINSLWPFTDFFWPGQAWMILALPFMLLYNGEKGMAHKHFFYVYYPVHRVLLSFMGVLIKS